VSRPIKPFLDHFSAHYHLSRRNDVRISSSLQLYRIMAGAVTFVKVAISQMAENHLLQLVHRMITVR
jgi:hypothetical protein